MSELTSKDHESGLKDHESIMAVVWTDEALETA